MTTMLGRYMEELKKRAFIHHLWTRSPAAWDGRANITNWLGWMQLPQTMAPNIPHIELFAQKLRKDGFTDVVLLGMGGSSLAPLVLGALLEEKVNEIKKVKGEWPSLRVLDSTDPAIVAGIEKQINLEKTLFIVASKSGTTIEPNSFYKYFRSRVQSANAKNWAQQFVAITDENTTLHKEALAGGFRDVFIAPSDVGGRYSALSYFGMVPAMCAGFPVARLLVSAREMAVRCSSDVPLADNPGFQLGLIMGAAALEGRDKLTLVLPPSWLTFGLWIEQLIAESTGKEGKGIVPVAGESVGSPAVYGNDRLFVQIHILGEEDSATDQKIKALQDEGHPVVTINVQNATDIGAEFFRWEFATATAGAVMGINPFDQPNVQAAKDRTNKIISQFVQTGQMPVSRPTATENGISIYSNTPTFQYSNPRPLLRSFLSQVKANDYLAILAYLPMETATEGMLQQARMALRDKLHVATTFGYGPRYLHSTGQLHKGGANNGVFVIITTEPTKDLPIPGEKFTFAQLEMAQALGDTQALQDAGRRVVRLHLDQFTQSHIRTICSWLIG